MLSKYCYNKGMNIEEYNQLKLNISNTAYAILYNIKTLHKTDTGMYYPVSEIIKDTNNDISIFIISKLKSLGVEFIDNNTLYRF